MKDNRTELSEEIKKVRKIKSTKIYNEVMGRLRTDDLGGSVIRTAISIALDEVEKDMSLINQGYGNRPEMFFVISESKWREIKGEFKK